MVLCLLPCYHFSLLFILRLLRRRQGKASPWWLLLNSVYQFFVMKIYVASKLDVFCSSYANLVDGWWTLLEKLRTLRFFYCAWGESPVHFTVWRTFFALTWFATQGQRSDSQFKASFSPPSPGINRGEFALMTFVIYNVTLSLFPADSLHHRVHLRHRVMKFSDYGTSNRRMKCAKKEFSSLLKLLARYIAIVCIHFLSNSQFIHHLRTYFFFRFLVFVSRLTLEDVCSLSMDSFLLSYGL